MIGLAMRPLVAPIAPEQSEHLASAVTTPPGPQDVQYRPRVEPLAPVPSFDTFSAGQEIARIPRVFDLPSPLRSIYRRLRGGMQTTLLAPELQSEITAAGGGDVMAPKGMAHPYDIRAADPWYESFSRTIG